MKKLLLIAILMLALVITVVACTGDKNPEDTTIGDTTVETPTEAPTAEPDDPTEAPTAEPDDPTEAPTAEPEDPTEAPTDKPENPTDKPEDPTEEQTTADPMEPVNVFDAEALNTLTGANEIEATEVVNGYLHVIPKGPDPYWYPFANVKGARYVVIRYRTADAVGADVQLYIGSHGTAPVDDGSMLRQPAIVDGEWHLAIFDTQSLIDAGIYNGQHVSFFRLDPIEAGYKLDENGQPYKPDGLAYARYELPEGCSVDVSYVAFFHSIEAAEAYELKVNAPYVEPDAAGKVNHSFDTFYVNGQMYFPEDGQAGDKLTAQNNTVTFGMDDLCDSMMLRGWIGFAQPIASFGYYIDSYKMIYKDFATATEDGVKAAGGEHASRFEILVPLAELESGVHTVGFVAMLEDGTVVRLREELKVVIVPYHKDETLILGVRDPAGAPFSGAPDMKFGQRGQIGENILKKVTIMDLATYADGNTNTWSFKVWQWNTDYATTVAGEPLFAITGENHQDNATFVMDIPVELFIGGDIYYEIEYLTGSGCFTAWPATDVVAGLETYVNGQLKEGAFAATITVGVKAERPENPDEETIIDVSGEESTQVVFGEIYEDADKGTLFDGNLHIEKNLGPAYFDGVRTNDWMEFKINVETAGDYNVCMVFGWLDHTGVYTILVDGAEAGKIVNTIPGTDWRAWGDSSPVKINLTEGEHTVRVVMGSDGPNVYGIKFTYVEPMPESIALNKPISADSVEKPQHEAIYANDGDENTRWCALPKGEANLILDLEAVYTLDKIYLLLENAMGDFTISVSENGEEYIEVCACEGKPMSPVAFTLDFDLNGATGRYIKISRGPADDQDYWFSIYELYVYGTCTEEPKDPTEEPEVPVDMPLVNVTAEGETKVVFGEIYTDADKGTLFGGNLVIERNLGPAYFDVVRNGDWMEFKINVAFAGSYDVYMSFGWLDHTGTYTINVDGAEAGVINNRISGTDWRAWTDSTSVKINLTEGEHTVRVVMGSDGPNVYAINFAPSAPERENIALNKPASSDSVENTYLYPASNAVDGDESTRWSALPRGEANLIIDLEAVYTLDKIGFLLENAMGDFTISVSEDGEAYTVICNCEGKPMSPTIFTSEYDLNGATGRYIKITRGPDDGTTDYWFSMFEMYVYSAQ